MGPRAFDQREQRDIRHQLRKEGGRLFRAGGVTKTSIEQITSCVGIAKGSFYRFYSSKELLFFELLEESQNELRAPLVANETRPGARTREHFESLVRTMFRRLCGDPFVQLMGQERELIAIQRKVPATVLQAHRVRDQEFLEALISRWSSKSIRFSRDAVAARVTVLVLVALKQDFFGDRLLQFAVDAAVASLADCFFAPLNAPQELTSR